MLIGVVVGPTLEEAKEQIEVECDLLEFRKFEELREMAKVPVIMKVRDVEEIDRILELKPDYIDLEYQMPVEVFEKVGKVAKVICSYHNFEETPEDLEGVLNEIQKRPADLYKIATFAQSSLDSMRMLKLVRQHDNLIGVCMGECGQFTRILAPITYAPIDLEHASAPGQLDIKTLKEVYHYDRLNMRTKVLALIGDPVSKSLSHITHNEVMRRLGIDGVFVKIKVKEGEETEFLRMADELGFHGFSITMPLKEKIFLGEVVNTILMPDKGTNTDGPGTLDAIEERLPVQGKQVVVLGAGGAGKAIASEAKRRGAEVILLNRTPGRGGALGFDQFPKVAKEGYDVLINATSASMKNERLPMTDLFLPGKVMMDVVYAPVETVFLQDGKKIGCTPVYGTKMFIDQAVYQFKFWFGEEIEPKEILEEMVEKCLKFPLQSPTR